jgi:peroxiredoxin
VIVEETVEYQMAPDFMLIDHSGREVRLSDFRGDRNVVLVFNRGFM